METRTTDDNLDLLFGLRTYFTFTGNENALRLIKNLISLKFGSQEHKNFIINRVTVEDYHFYSSPEQEATRDSRMAMYADFSNGLEANWTVEKILSNIKGILDDLVAEELITKLHELTAKFENDNSVRDAYSKGQVLSKVWMVETLQKLINPKKVFDNIVIIGGWYGHLTHYLKDKIFFDNFYNIDPDEQTGYIGKTYFNPHLSFRYIPSCVPIESVEIDPDAGYKIPLGDFVEEDGKQKFIVSDFEYVNPDLVINTSSEHMTTEWFENIPNGKMVALQTNNLVDVSPDHINCIKSISELEVKYPMRRVLFQGELDISVGKRYMMIGIK
jgi:hypothetical protein